MKVLIVGTFGVPGTLAISYQNAFTSLGWEVVTFDLYRTHSSYQRFGKLGRYFDSFVPVEAWHNKTNRDLVVACRKHSPDLVLVMSTCPVRAGALAQIRSSSPCKIVLVWPDPMVNLSATTLQCLPVYDLVASYSNASVPEFQRLGAPQVIWVPLACDPSLYEAAKNAPPPEYACDVSFIGNWRPEREQALAAMQAIPEITIRIWGTDDWQRRTTSEFVKRSWQGKVLFTNDFAAACRASKVSLNVIDDTNYPAANMRFFELPCVGATQISSPCPELATEFLADEHLAYFHNETELLARVRELLAATTLRDKLRQNAQDLVLSNHTYKHRVQQIVAAL